MTQCILAGYAPYVPSKANASTGGREATLIATTPMCCNVVALRSPSAHSSMRRSTFWLSLKGPGRHSPTCGGSVCIPLPTKVQPRSRAALAFASVPEPKRGWLLMKAPLNNIASSRVRENQAPAGTQTSTHSFALLQSHVTYLWIHFQKPSRLHFESGNDGGFLQGCERKQFKSKRGMSLQKTSPHYRSPAPPPTAEPALDAALPPFFMNAVACLASTSASFKTSLAYFKASTLAPTWATARGWMLMFWSFE